MTEDIRVEDGHLKTDRASSKPNVDVAVSEIRDVNYVRPAIGGGEGNVMVYTKDGGMYLLKVDEEDAGDVLDELRNAMAPKANNDKANDKQNKGPSK